MADLEVDRMITLGITDQANKTQIRTTLYNIFSSDYGEHTKAWLTQSEILSPRSIAVFELVHAPEGSQAYERLDQWLKEHKEWLGNYSHALEHPGEIGPINQIIDAVEKIRDGQDLEYNYGRILFQQSWAHQEISALGALATIAVSEIGALATRGNAVRLAEVESQGANAPKQLPAPEKPAGLLPSPKYDVPDGYTATGKYTSDGRPIFIDKNGVSVAPDPNASVGSGQMLVINSNDLVYPQPRTVRNLQGGPLANATQTRGNFDLENGPPNGTLYRADNQGNITSYIKYDANGQAVKRVDVTGKPHRDVPTPHVVDYSRNILPNGQVRVHVDTKAPPRRATPDEIP